MPIVERDPWRQQYFEGIACPDDVVVPTDDTDAWTLYPAHRWVYNKLLVCEKQGIEHAPHGIVPPTWPVFSKPIYNLRGMGSGGCVLRSRAEYERALAPGHMWMRLLAGEHVSTDAALVWGEPVWWRHTVGTPLAGGAFDYWTVLAERRADLEATLGDFARTHLAGYTGLVNFETIGGAIIECHLRFADQWPDLYGAGWIESVVRLYTHGAWELDEEERRTGYSVVLFGRHGRRWTVDHAAVALLRRLPGVSSIQITFHEDRAPELHAMPPGGFRLAIVNAWDLAVGQAVRERLATAITPVHPRLVSAETAGTA